MGVVDRTNFREYRKGRNDSHDVPDQLIDTAQLADGAVTPEKLSADAVELTAMADDSVDSAQIVDGAVDLAHMSANSVDSDQYVDGSIDTVHLADDVVTNAKLGPRQPKTYKFTYDFAVHGGAVGVIPLTALDGNLPAGFIVAEGYIICETAVTSGGAATIAIGTTSVLCDVATAYTDNMYDTPGSGARCVTITNNASVRVCAGAEAISATVADAALTAGKFHVYITGFDG